MIIPFNLLGRDFSATAPNQKWLADRSYILASVEDIFPRKIVGWALDIYAKTSLLQRVLHMALEHRQPGKGVLHYSAGAASTPVTIIRPY